ncbi:MAG: zinc ribbon domain-containing protein [Chloroflexi bacterium]|nr:MAG: zinc ribbon domain-containing protein [Chloroflexota bacterium]
MTADRRRLVADLLSVGKGHVWVTISRYADARLAVGGRFIFIAATILLATVALALASPASAQEPTGPTIEQLQVDLWPQYDDPRLLVIYTGTLSAPPDQPLRFPIPADAQVNAVAHLNDQDQLINEPWQPQIEGDQQVITFTPTTARFQLEYYLDVIGPGPDRSFTVDIDVGGQPVKLLGIAVQQPAGASNLRGEPALMGPVAGFQGLNYFSRQVENVQPGQTVRQTVTYTKSDDRLSVDVIGPAASEQSGAQPQPTVAPSGTGFSTNFAGRSTTQFWLPIGATAVILIGLALIAVGAWRARQTVPVPAEPTARRQRGGRRTRPSRATEEGPAKFCNKCGATFAPDDRFCAECGAPRRGI